MDLPLLIQGGMGVGISGWRLARSVSELGHLGVVAGTALDLLLARRLQAGDPGGELREAMAAFPVPAVAERALERYFVPGGVGDEEPFRRLSLHSLPPSRERLQLTVLASWVEVVLARAGHGGPVGINLMEKLQIPNLASLYGAMLAGVDFVLMGAGIPREIPAALDRLACHEEATLTVPVAGTDGGVDLRFDPLDVLGVEPDGVGRDTGILGGTAASLVRPFFVAIVSSTTLARVLATRSEGRVDGFVVEGHGAGGHNAPPRGRLDLDRSGEPIYGERDTVDLDAIRDLGRPFWLAGGYGRPERIVEALDRGATGVQVGTPFAFCEESGLAPRLKRRVLESVRTGDLTVRTDPLASPTGFPFKVVQLPGTLAEPAVYEARPRRCDLGYLRTPYLDDDGRVRFRCPAEPEGDYVRKGGEPDDTRGRCCLCNALLANIGLEQVQPEGYREPPMVTSGRDLAVLKPFVEGGHAYTAADVVQWLCDGLVGSPPA